MKKVKELFGLPQRVYNQNKMLHKRLNDIEDTLGVLLILTQKMGEKGKCCPPIKVPVGRPKKKKS